MFIAPPAAGKGTQADLVIEKYNIPHISTGDILRNILYSGVWTRFEMTKQKREKKQEEDHEGSI